MEFNIMHVFETSLDVVGITLSCVIISYLIYNRIKYNQMILSRKYKNNINSFNSQVAVKMIKQQTERSFDTIYGMINKERRKFKRLIEKEEIKNAKYLMMMMEKGHLLEKVINVKAMDEVQAGISADPYDEISRLVSNTCTILNSIFDSFFFVPKYEGQSACPLCFPCFQYFLHAFLLKILFSLKLFFHLLFLYQQTALSFFLFFPLIPLQRTFRGFYSYPYLPSSPWMLAWVPILFEYLNSQPLFTHAGKPESLKAWRLRDFKVEYLF